MLPEGSPFGARQAAAQQLVQYAGGRKAAEKEMLSLAADGLLSTLMTTLGLGPAAPAPGAVAGKAAGAIGGQDVMAWLTGLLGQGQDLGLGPLTAEQQALLQDLK